MARTAPGSAVVTGSRKSSKVKFINDPLWYKDAVVYQLHLKSYYDANDDGVGDFHGLIEKLDYIAGLGVNTIWLLPFYPSPRRDDGYDIAEYRDVHPDYGDLADARRFVAEAHNRGLRVITELVINHTSDQHPWFQRARKAKPGSKARNFYVWSDSDGKYAGTRIIFLDAEKSNWTWDPVANAYYWHRFYSHQPDLNFDNPQVMKAVLSVMRFWLDLGVDGLRLDAVPYLVEREGTSNENLPETHLILKRIRAEIDAHYPDRMLLAEANQWPEDTQEYFGQGDECHMAFHFPLMPRMYMALAQEDRFPITDILRQTPEIPGNCQWAVFLRNHDELTLEMVTERERDYLWETYAAERRARLNLGIRRRLAPLLERDRRRIELMNGLLLSMPGTPVIYYGDEIGMGDNIHLGDRDGVRTPMQWSFDRNGGFSRADPATLVLPPIMDPLYGYQAINVEAQARDPHSLLNWMRRMLGVRKQQQTFGRGTLRLLYPSNRRVLAYLREYTPPNEETRTILCVANVSRSAQAVELDLHGFDGRVPVEMVGGSAFPPVGQLPYLLTLPPYGFYWFQLAAEAQMPSWYSVPPEPMPDHITLVLRSGIADLLKEPSRGLLQNDILPAYLPKRRWFSIKNEPVQSVRITHATPLGGLAPILLTEVELETARGKDSFQLPLGFLPEEQQVSALQHQLALTRLRHGRRVGLLTDAFTIPAFAHQVMKLLREDGRISVDDGEVRFIPTSNLAQLDLAADAEVRLLAAEQSNSSLSIGERVIVKLIRHIASGQHPEAEMGRVLTERGFKNIAPLLGEVTRVSSDGIPRVLMVVQEFLHNQGDAWSWTQNMLERAIQDAILPMDGASPEQKVDAHLEFQKFAGILGKRIGEMHTVLAQPSDDPAFTPERATAADCARWADATRARIDEALQLLGKQQQWPSEEDRLLAQELAGRRKDLHRIAGKLANAGAGTLLTRTHGDLHLGQILVSQEDAYIIDFEGEPARPLEERRAKSSPFRDVAGMLRSFEYAAAMSERALAGRSEESMPRMRGVIERFRPAARESFLAQHAEAASAAYVGNSEAAAALIDLFTLEKAAYEVAYEIANRPTWLNVPLQGLAAITRRLSAMEENNAG
jgi:maltose alpha-D-glucosyltransferase/alpha-amylase